MEIFPDDACGRSAGGATRPRGSALSAGKRLPEAGGRPEPPRPGREAGPGPRPAQRVADPGRRPGRRVPLRLTPQAANGKPGFFRDFASRRSNCPISTQEANGSSRANVGGQRSQSAEGRFLTNEIKELAEWERAIGDSTYLSAPSRPVVGWRGGEAVSGGGETILGADKGGGEAV